MSGNRSKSGGGGGKPKANDRRKKEKGGARKFVTSAEEMAMRDIVEEKKQSARKIRRNDGEDGSDDDDDDDDDEEGNFDDLEEADDDNRVHLTQAESLAKLALEEPKKKTGVAAIIQVNNPNLAPKQNKVMKAKDMDTNFEQKLSRREREAIEKERARAAYMQRHLAGETAEAKKDLERLEMVRKRREEAEKRRKEEEEAARALEEKAKKAQQVKTSDEPLDARVIKQMKPAVIKDKLKERGLSTQGQKKDLIQRLIDYENEQAL